MGFYFDLEPVGPSLQEFAETRVPPSFWFLFSVAGFALACMFLAAYSLFWKLAVHGSAWDQLLVGLIVAAVPFYFLIGIKIVFLRKFVQITASSVQTGFRFKSFPFLVRNIDLGMVDEVLLINRRPSENVAPRRHGDSQYFIRGHWRVGLRLKNGKTVVLDRHTEREALEPLFEKLQRARPLS